MCDLDLHYPVEPSEMEWSLSFSRTCFSIYPSMNMKQTELFFSVGFESCWKSKSLPGVQLLKALWENGWAKKMGEKSRKRKWKNACGQTLKQVIPIYQDLVYPLISEFDRFCQHPSINCTDEKCGMPAVSVKWRWHTYTTPTVDDIWLSLSFFASHKFMKDTSYY